MSWAVGVAFGRFDIDAGLGFKTTLSPEPFDEMEEVSPGMRKKGKERFHSNHGVLVGDPSHEFYLPSIVSRVLDVADIDFDGDVSRWVEKNLFDDNFKRYSKSRRNAPVYWPLSTVSGSYKIWVYSQELTNESIFICINDFVQPKLDDLRKEIDQIPADKEGNDYYMRLVSLEQELKDFHDELVGVGKHWVASIDDGLQIVAAPLWKLMSGTCWRSKLKATWEDLEVGKFDWSKMAYSYWPDRVIRSAHMDRSIAIAHDLEADLWEEVEITGARGRGVKLVWRPKRMTEVELHDYIQQKIGQG